MAGIALGFLLGYQERNQERFLHRIIAAGCVLGTVAILAWAIVIAVYFRFILT